MSIAITINDAYDLKQFLALYTKKELVGRPITLIVDNSIGDGNVEINPQHNGVTIAGPIVKDST